MKIYRDKNTILETLLSKKGVVKTILDTDTYNEIDDQFALVQMLLSKERIEPVCNTPQSMVCSPIRSDFTSATKDDSSTPARCPPVATA